MKQPQFSKFSPITITVKKNLRSLRLARGFSMNEGAKRLGVSRKQLEDIETVRNYGCHLDLELLAKVCIEYRVHMTVLVGDLPTTPSYLERPRKRVGSSSRKSKR